MLFKIAFREICNRPLFVWLFISNLSMGMIGLILVENFKSAFEKMIVSQGQTVLGADVQLTSRAPIPPETVNRVEKYLNAFGLQKVSVLLGMFSMGVSDKKSHLIFIASNDGQFPFYGGIHLSGQPDRSPPPLKESEIWASEGTLRRFQLARGETIFIGGAAFTIQNSVVEEASEFSFSESLAPKVFMSPAGIVRAGLVQKGSTVRHRYYYKLRHRPSDRAIQELQELLQDHSIVITTPLKASQNMGRAVNYLMDFLGLVSLSALFLSFIGFFYLYRSYLASKLLDVAILSSLGLSRRAIVGMYFFQALVLGVAGMSMGMVTAFLLSPVLESLAMKILPQAIELPLSWEGFVLALLVGTVGITLLSFPSCYL